MKNLQRILSMFVLASLFLSGCDVVDLLQGTPAPTPAASLAQPQAMITFRLTLPEPLASGETIYLVFVDEITGLPFNQQKVAMTHEDATHLIAIIPLPQGSIVKYRYARQGAYLAQEYTPDGRPVRYRMLEVNGPEKVEDLLARWVDTVYNGPAGRITGKILDAKTLQPLADMLVFVGGMQTLSDADGAFRLEGLPPGVHNMMVYAPDGKYKPFQQGARVAADSATPAQIMLEPFSMMKVVFVVQVPSDTPPGAVVRIAGSLLQLGETFSEQRGEITALARRMPAMQALPDGRYTMTLDLPVGAEIHYRYTLGDGLWNAEHTEAGAFGERRLVVSASMPVVEDSVASWRFGDPAPVTFAVRVPAVTPEKEKVSIQFNPGYGWTEPIPMWPSGQNQWFFTLYSPLIGIGNLQYRYCRELDCGSADEASSMGMLAAGRTVTVEKTAKTVSDQVDAWGWYNGPQRLAVVPSTPVTPRAEGFAAGVAFQGSGYNPNWDLSIPGAIHDAAAINANWIYLSPTWGITRLSPPVFEPVLGRDMPASLVGSALREAGGSGLKAGLFPTLRYPTSPDEWWKETPQTFSWWVSWFETYRQFIVTFADQAQAQNAGALIMGGPDLAPALPGGLFADGAPTAVPADAEIRWTQIISDVRSHYSGPLYWAVAYPQQLKSLPHFLNKVDGLFVLWSVKLASQATLDIQVLAPAAATELDANLLPLHNDLGKTIILAVSYPSARGALTGCIIYQEGSCASFLDLARPMPDLQGVQLDMEEQEAAYNAMLQAVNERPWIGGLVSQGYYLPEPLQDKSLSVRGKPASGVLWFWFAKFLNK